MGFKVDSSFLRFVTIGVLGVQRTMDQLRGIGFDPIQLERYCGCNKIWATKVKRLRLPDVLCVKTGLRVEVRAKTDLKIRMSDALQNPDRAWDAGNRDEDVVAFIACFDGDEGPKLADRAVFFRFKELRDSVGESKLGPAKSASEGAERDRIWPAIVPNRDGRVGSIKGTKLIVEMAGDHEHKARPQTYRLKGKTAYVSPGDSFSAKTMILAGAPSAVADLRPYLKQRYVPFADIQSANSVDRYAAVKALRFRNDPRDRVVARLERMLRHEPEDRVALEAAGSATAFGSAVGQERISGFIWHNEERPELRMEAVLILTELGRETFVRNQLKSVVTHKKFNGQEIRQAALWGLGKAGLKCYEDLLPFIDDSDENVALHAIAGFGSDTPKPVIQHLVKDLMVGEPRRAAAASEVLRIIGTSDVLEALTNAANIKQPVPEWVLASLGRLRAEDVRQHLRGSPLLERVSPMLLFSKGANWLTSERLMTDMTFLLKQNIF
jgi:hypothetical protein